MKIGIDIRLIGKKRTGDEAVFFNLVKNLAKIDQENRYFLLTDESDDGKLMEIGKLLEVGSNFEIIPLKCGGRFAWNFSVLPKYLNENSLDVYLTQYITPMFVSRKTKIVTIVHDISFNFFPQFIKLADLLFLKTLLPLSLKRADYIVGVSEFTKDEIIKYYKVNPGKVDFIHNSVATEFLDSEISEAEKARVKEKYQLPNEFFLYLGTMQPRKNIPFLLKSFLIAKQELPGAKLVLAGSRHGHNYDREIDKIIDFSNLHDEVIFTGYVPEEDKKALYHLATSFVFPSLYEGFGIPVLEALSQGVPVLASDIPSLKEVAGEAAIFEDTTSVSSIEKFAKKMYDINNNNELRGKLIQAGQSRISFFSWTKSASSILAIFEKTVHNRQVN